MDLDHLMSTYSQLPVAFERGEGAWLWDTQGKKYLDAISGVAVNGLGHNHPAVVAAICQQAARVIHTSNIYHIPRQKELAERLTHVTGMERAFFCNSGAEANEAAIKLARLHGHQQGIANPAIVVADNSFHGRTLATLTATGNRKVQAGFEPLVQGFLRVSYNDIEALRTIAKNSTNVVAVLLEPVQGEGGVNIPDADYLPKVRELCDEFGWLMMLDEVQTGMGRTGKWLGYQHSSIFPDVVTLAKALGNGLPIGACLGRGAAANVFQPGNHASTFGGNPLACSAALAVINTLESEKLPQRAAQLGDYLLSRFRQALEGNGMVKAIRGKGLMLGIELVHPCGELVRKALEQGLLINVTAERVVRLLPPLVMTDADADLLVERLTALIADFAASHANVA